MAILAKGLPADEFDVRFLLLSERGPLADVVEAAGTPVHVLGLRQRDCSPLGPRCIPAAARALRRYRSLTRGVDIVDAWLAPAMTFAVAAQLVAQVPVLVGGRRSLNELYRSRPWYRRAAASFALRRMAAVVSNTRIGAAELTSEDGVPARHVVVIPNAVELARPSSAERQRYRAGWRVSDAQLVVGCVANYKHEKGLDVLVEAAAVVHQRHPDVRFVVVGEGPMRLELERAIGRRQLDGVVILHGPEADARSVYQAFDLLVQASRTEGLPNVILEGAAAGLPIVATRVGGTTEVLTDEQDALLVPPADAATLATALERAIGDPALRARLAEAALERSSDFAPERLIESTAALYRRLAAASPKIAF